MTSCAKAIIVDIPYFHDATGTATGWIDQATGYVTFPPSAGDGRGVVTSADGKNPGCDRVRCECLRATGWRD